MSNFCPEDIEIEVTLFEHTYKLQPTKHIIIQSHIKSVELNVISCLMKQNPVYNKAGAADWW